MMRVQLFTSLLLLTLSSQAFCWGQNGHRIVGHIANSHLTETTRKAIKPLLAGDLLPEVATWADEMRSAPDDFWQKKSGRWHYINVEQPEAFEPEHYHVPQDKDDVEDIYGATLKAIAVLKSRRAPLEEQQFYFRFLVHLVGDIHQPLHAGHAHDRGGNDINVSFFGDTTNLHSLWDTGLIESRQLSYREFAEFIDTRDAQFIKRHLNSSPADWLKESMVLSKSVYASGTGELGYAYIYQQMPHVELRLVQAGVRLAGLLNSIYDSRAKVGVHATPALTVKVAEPKRP